MRIPRYLLLVLVSCFLSFASRAQHAGWKSLEYGKLSLKYPATWHMAKESHGQMTRVSLTPDSMQNLSMRMVVIWELPLDDDHNYAFYKRSFKTLCEPVLGSDAKYLKTSEIRFKEHKSVYAEVIASSLPTKIYGIDAGAYIYQVIVTERRYSAVADAKMEADETSIMNSVTIGQ